MDFMRELDNMQCSGMCNEYNYWGSLCRIEIMIISSVIEEVNVTVDWINSFFRETEKLCIKDEEIYRDIFYTCFVVVKKMKYFSIFNLYS